MICKYSLNEQKIDLEACIAHHSGDKTIAYKTVDGVPVNLSFYYPDDYNKNNKYPAFIFIHGGGWASHKIFDDQKIWQGDYLGYLARYYAYKGFISVSIDYRLSKEKCQKENYQLIDLYDDCSDAVDYILDKADDCGIDMQNVFVLGESAGGHLAGLITTKYKRAGFDFKGSFLINAITDLEGDALWGKSVPLKSVHPALVNLPQSQFAKYLSPLYNIGENTCPVVLIHGEKDKVVDPVHSERFYNKMKSISRKCKLHIIENTDHAFLLAEYTNNIVACKIGIKIIDEWIQKLKKA